MNGLIKWLGGRKFIVAQMLIVASVLLGLTDSMTSQVATVLTAVGAGYGISNVMNKKGA